MSSDWFASEKKKMFSKEKHKLFSPKIKKVKKEISNGVISPNNALKIAGSVALLGIGLNLVRSNSP